MPRLIDLTGQRFGRLTVVERANKPGEGASPTWLCRCDCGNTKIYKTSDLRSKGVVSCGCWQRQNAADNLARMHRGAKLGLVASTNISRISSRTVQRNNSTGYPGVSVQREKNGQIKYRADYYFQGKRHYLGVYKTPEEAHAVREKAVEEARAPILEAYRKGAMERRCAECGNLFMPSNAIQITCSPECARRRHNAQVAAYQRAKYMRMAKRKKRENTERDAATTERIPCVYYRAGRWIAAPRNQYIGCFGSQKEAAAAVEQYKADHPDYKPRKRHDGQEAADKPPIPYVHYAKGRWVASPNSKYLGSFDTQKEAAEAVERYKADHPEFQPRAKRRTAKNVTR